MPLKEEIFYKILCWFAVRAPFSKQNHHPAYRHAENIYDGGTDTDDDECPLESSTTMNPYEYETTLDCRDDTRTIGGGGGGGSIKMPIAHFHDGLPGDFVRLARRFILASNA
ncbi:hypothetical protein GQX74_003452 [Glossina fuscipes]|nr:hypothetical protein GQX74_003452 [Glossina fuscipes]